MVAETETAQEIKETIEGRDDEKAIRDLIRPYKSRALFFKEVHLGT